MSVYRNRLYALLIAALLPLAGLASVLVIYVAKQERLRMEERTQEKVYNVVSLLNREIAAQIKALEVLATSEALDESDLERFKKQAERIKARERLWYNVILATADGDQVINLLGETGHSLGRTTSWESHRAVLRTGSPAVGRINESGNSAERSVVTLAVPVKRDGQIRYVLSAKLRPDVLSMLLRDPTLPHTWVGAIADQNGRIIARSKDIEKYAGWQGSRAMLDVVYSGKRAGFYDAINFDGVEITAAFRKSAFTRWSVHYGIPRDTLEIGFNKAFIFAAFGGVGSIVLSALLGLLIYRDTRSQQDADETLRQAQKMEAIGQITGGVAHDFNNLLTVITGSLALVLPTIQDPKAQRRLELALQASERGANLTRQLLTFSRRAALNTEQIDLAARIESIRGLIEGALRQDIILRTDIQQDLWLVDVDAEQLDLAIVNMAVNARDAMPNGGTFRISASNVTLPDRAIPETTGLKGNFIHLAFVDTGAGMSPDIAQRAFDPFFTTKGKEKGTGLGLSQVYGFAKQSKGLSVIRSHPGTGTTILIYLPQARTNGTLDNQQKRAAATQEPEHLPLRVLVVEDDPQVAETAAAMLSQLGHQSTVVDRADQALEQLSSGSGFELILSDVVMPGPMNGIGLANEVRRLYPELPLLLVTGYAAELDNAHQSMVCNVLRKPYEINALNEAIQHCMAKVCA